MSGTDIFVAVLSAVMLFGGLYLNIMSRRLSNQYFASYNSQVSQKSAAPKSEKKS